jgi:hypothetical protein
VSYKTRERKRQAKIQAHQAVSAARAKHSAKTAVKHYLRHVRRDCRCASCGGYLRRGAEMIYRHSGPVTLCVPCADRDPLVSYVPSARWEMRKRQEVRAKARKAAKAWS